MVKITKRDLAIIAGTAGVADFLAEGRLSAPLARALKKSAVAIGKRALMTAPAAARVTAATLPRLGMTALKVGKTIALRHPVLTAGAVVYYTYKNREEIADLVEQGYDIVQPVVEPVVQETLDITRPARQELMESMMPRRPITGKLFPAKAERKPSSFNKAVAASMKTVKASTSYGPKGKISNPRKAFSAITKVISKVKKGKKAPTKGILGKVAREARKRFRRSLFRRRKR
jgi:hypothetical protein